MVLHARHVFDVHDRCSQLNRRISSVTPIRPHINDAFSSLLFSSLSSQRTCLRYPFLWRACGRCSQSKSKFASCQSNSSTGYIDYVELRQNLDISMPGSEPMSIWINSLVLLIALVAFRSGGYLVLRFLRKPK